MKLKSILLLSSAVLVASNSFGQYNSSTNGSKYTLVEEATGPGCGYCPDGSQDLEQSVDSGYAHALIASWHGTTYDATNMVVAGDPFCGTTGYIAGFPMATIDRAPFSGAVGQSRPWESYVGMRDVLTPKFDVSMKCTYDPTTKVISIKVIAKALSAQTGSWNVNALIVEDSVSSGTSSSFNQHSYLNGTTTACNGKPSWYYGKGSTLASSWYSHMNVVRASLGATIFGDAAFTNPAAGASFSKDYSYTINTTISNPVYVKVLGMIQKPGPANTTTGNPIENVIQARVRLMPAIAPLGANEIQKSMAEVTIYPNPAKNKIMVKGVLSSLSETNIDIYNAVGQVVFQKAYPVGGSLFGEVIDLSNLASGEYFMSIANDGETTIKQFSVSK